MTQLPPKVLKALQHRAARGALSASSMRGTGSRGVVKAGRDFLFDIDLAPFGTSSQEEFRAALDRQTDQLRKSLPAKARHWGLARKGLNIFLRECLYTVYLRDAYNLGAAEGFFEVPLDSLTGKALHSKAPKKLPRWQTVRGLEQPLSNQFQEVASRLAHKRGIARIHLDAIWWGQRSEP